MPKKCTPRPPLFVHSAAFDQPILHGLEEAEAVLDGFAMERLMSSIDGSKTGRPSYPFLTSFRRLLLGIRYRLSDEQPAERLFWDLLLRKFCRLEWDGVVPDGATLGRSRRSAIGRSRPIAAKAIIPASEVGLSPSKPSGAAR